LQHGYAGYWNAPIFYPTPNTFALSEPQALTGIVYAVLRSLSTDITAYNLVVLFSLTLNGLAARRMLKVSGVSDVGALLGGAFAVALPFAMKELGVIQLLALYAPLFALAELCVVLQGKATAATWLKLAAACVATLWTCIYYALFLAPLLALGLVLALVSRRVSLRPRAHGSAVVAALALSVLCAAPLYRAQQHALAAHHRSASAVRNGSATVNAYLRMPDNAPLARVVPLPKGKRSARNMFPGTALVLLAALGFWRERNGTNKLWVLYCGGALVFALVLSFGTRWSVFGYSIYEHWIQAALPGYAQLRSPYRLAAFVDLYLVALAGFGIDGCLKWRAGSTKRAWVPAALLLCTLELVPWPQPLQRFPSEQLTAPWVQWLAEHPGGAVAMVPPAKSGKSKDYEPVTLAMLQSLAHGHPLVDGYSGFFPAANDALTEKLRHFPNPATLHALQHWPVRYVVIDDAWANAQHVKPDDTVRWKSAMTSVQASAGRTVYEMRVGQ
jgi:hypothetical protein